MTTNSYDRLRQYAAGTIAEKQYAAQRLVDFVSRDVKFFELMKMLLADELPDVRASAVNALRMILCRDPSETSLVLIRPLLAVAIQDTAPTVQEEIIGVFGQHLTILLDLLTAFQSMELSEPAHQNLREAMLAQSGGESAIDAEEDAQDEERPIRQMLRRHQREIQELQANCLHQNKSGRMEECWAIAHSTGWQVVCCLDCDSVLERFTNCEKCAIEISSSSTYEGEGYVRPMGAHYCENCAIANPEEIVEWQRFVETRAPFIHDDSLKDDSSECEPGEDEEDEEA